MKHRRRAPQHPRRVTVPVEQLIAADKGLQIVDETWKSQGYALTSGRLWRRKDGTFTARLVWRRRGAVISTLSYTVEGFVLQ